MKKVLFIAALLCFAVFGAQAQSLRQGQKFSDGEQCFEVDAIWENEQTVFMTAPGEIYMTLKMVKGKTGEYTLAPYGDVPVVPVSGAKFGARVQHLTQPGAEFLLVYDARGNVVRVLESQGVTPESLKGEWRWVGPNIPELILVLDTDEDGDLAVKDLYTYRNKGYRDPRFAFDGETLWIRWDKGENAYLELTLKPNGEDLTGRCQMIGVWEREFDEDITLRRDYFEYDKQ